MLFGAVSFSLSVEAVEREAVRLCRSTRTWDLARMGKWGACRHEVTFEGRDDEGHRRDM
jgi:hypothetical protein